jgi:reactive intermediate/imine deaminase
LNHASDDLDRIATAQAPTPAGHYAQATAFRDLVFVSGQLPVRAGGTHDERGDFEAQARQAIANVLAIVRAAGSEPADVLKVTAYIVGVDNWPLFNRVYADAFGDARPARSVIPVPELHYGYLIELEAIARRKSGDRPSTGSG